MSYVGPTPGLIMNLLVRSVGLHDAKFCLNIIKEERSRMQACDYS
jgi:hypothetical protein